jgi:uncharacterized membrane protein
MSELENKPEINDQFDKSKWSSRKLIITYLEMGLIISMPILYQKLGISNEVQLIVVGMLGVSAGIYKYTNAMSKE